MSLEWSQGARSSIDRCFTAGQQEYCFCDQVLHCTVLCCTVLYCTDCDQYMRTLCNTATILATAATLALVQIAALLVL